MAHRHRARHSCFIKNENKNCQLWKNTICPFVPFHESNECGLRKKVPSVWLSASGAELCCYGLVFACQDCLHLENPAPQNFHFKKARLGCGVVCLLRSLKWHMDAVAGLCMARHFAPTGSVHCGEETFWRNWPTENVPVVLFLNPRHPRCMRQRELLAEARSEAKKRISRFKRTDGGGVGGLGIKQDMKWSPVRRQRWSTLGLEGNGGTARDELLWAHLGQTGLTESWKWLGWQHPATQASQVHLYPLVRVQILPKRTDTEALH